MVELLVTIFFLGIFMAVMVPVVFGMVRSLSHGQSRVDASQEARTALNRMVRDMREANSIQSVSFPDGSDWVRFTVDFNGDGVISNAGMATDELSEGAKVVLAHHKPGHGGGPPQNTTTTTSTSTTTTTTTTAPSTTTSTSSTTTTTTTAPTSTTTTTTLPLAGAETLRYTFDADNNELLLEAPESSPPKSDVLAENVESFALEYRSSDLQFDWNDDGVTTWDELDEAASHGVTGIGNNNDVLDVEVTHIDEIHIEIGIDTGNPDPNTQTFGATVEMRNFSATA